jgi:GNAT superfamily N-acetyltransferase
VSSLVRTRPARADDYQVFAQLFPELGIDDALPDQKRFTESIMPDALIAEIDGVAVGYARGRKLDETGHVVHIIVAPSHRQRGVARALMQEIAEDFRRQGLSRWCLNVKPDNQPALALYRGLGMETQYESSVIRFPWSLLEAWQEVLGEFELATPSPESDPAIESSFSMSSGRLESRRKSGDFVLLGIKEEEQWVACAAFSPDHPGAFPFKVKRPELALALLRGLREHATKPNMQIVVEDDPELVAFLLEQNASLYMRILHLEGPL